MSRILRSAMDALTPTVLTVVNTQTYQPVALQPRAQVAPWEDGMLWRGSRGTGGGLAGSMTQDSASASGRYEPWVQESGCSGRKTISGITRDSSGAALASVSVQATAADGSSAGDISVSDGSGYYTATIPDPTAGNYKVDAYKVGSPDVAGTTVNNLLPS